MAGKRKNGTWAAVVKDARHPARGTKRSRNDRGNYLPIEGYRNATLTDRASFLDCDVDAIWGFFFYIRRDFIYWMVSRTFERRNATIGYELERLGDFE